MKIIFLTTLKMRCDIHLDKLEIAYNASQEVRDRLEDVNYYPLDQFNLTRIVGKDYKNHFEITLDNGDKYGELYFGSYNVCRQKMYIRLDNKVCYDDSIGYLSHMESKLGIEFDSISHIDIAMDFDRNIINKFYRLLHNEEIDFIILNKRVGMAEEVKDLLNVSTGLRSNIHKFKSFYIQNKERGLTLNGYDKTKEIEDNGNVKGYIKEVLGFKHIYRLEVRTTHKLLLDTFTKLGIDDMYVYLGLLANDKSILYTLYFELLNRLVRIVYNNNNYNLIEMF